MVVGGEKSVVGRVGFHSRLAGSLMSSEGALKRLKLAARVRRMRVYPWTIHNPVSSPCPSWSVGPGPLLAVWDLCGVFGAVVSC